MNRFFRRMQRFGKPQTAAEPPVDSTRRQRAKRSHAEMANTQAEVFDAGTPQDVTSTRAKNQRHGKVTADKWNQ
jgi:hypothetical protein